VQAALEALPHINKEMLAALKQALAEAKRSLKKKNLAEFRAANQQFRLLIAEFTGNTLLQRLLRMINDRIRLVGALHLDVRKARADEALSENFAILDGIRKRVPAAVEAAVLLHIRNSREGIVQSAIGAAGGSTYLRKL